MISRENIGNQIIKAEAELHLGNYDAAIATALIALAKMKFTKLKINNV